MNIVVCTPGRLLQHMDENCTFSCEQLQILVIDEADRILDLGFSRQVIVIQNCGYVVWNMYSSLSTWLNGTSRY